MSNLLEMSRYLPELPIIFVWVGIVGIIELLIEKYVSNSFSSRLTAHVVLLLGVLIAEYIYDFNGNGKMF
jgi:hypothetical protein